MIFINGLSIITFAVIIYLIIDKFTNYLIIRNAKTNIKTLTDSIIGISFTEADSIYSNNINMIFADEDGER